MKNIITRGETILRRRQWEGEGEKRFMGVDGGQKHNKNKKKEGVYNIKMMEES